MLNALQPVVAGIAEDRTRERLEAVLPTVRIRWRLGDAAIADLAADPAFAAIPPEALTALAGLSGIAYPDERLFDGALASLPVPLDPATRAAILDVARKRVAEPYARRARSRRSPPTAAATSSAGRTRSSTPSIRSGASPAPTDAAPPPVDFDLVGRIAFDGLVLDAHGQLQLRAAVEGRGRDLHRLGAPAPGEGRPRDPPARLARLDRRRGAAGREQRASTS